MTTPPPATRDYENSYELVTPITLTVPITLEVEVQYACTIVIPVVLQIPIILEPEVIGMAPRYQAHVLQSPSASTVLEPLPTVLPDRELVPILLSDPDQADMHLPTGDLQPLSDLESTTLQMQPNLSEPDRSEFIAQKQSIENTDITSLKTLLQSVGVEAEYDPVEPGLEMATEPQFASDHRNIPLMQVMQEFLAADWLVQAVQFDDRSTASLDNEWLDSYGF